MVALLGGLDCGTNPEAVSEDANALQRQQMAWEIGRHQRFSPKWDSDQIIAEVKKVSEQLE